MITQLKYSRPAVEGGQPIRKEFLIFGAPLVEDDEIQEVVDTLKSGWLSTGAKTKRFEEEFKKYIGCQYAIALNSCTAGLHLCLLVSGIGPGDEVIVTPMTFTATVNVIEHVGAKPVFVDIEKNTFNLSARQIESKITPRTKAIIPVHFAGLPCRMDEIGALAKKYKLIVIEDAAHAVGAEHQGGKIGAFSDFTCFSFYVTKNLSTAEGGMITTNNSKAAARIRMMSLHGMDLGAWQRYQKNGRRHYEVLSPGFKYNMTDIAASLGIHQLRKLDRFLEIRQQYAEIYNRELGTIEEIILPPQGDTDQKNSWHLYPVMIRPEKLSKDRDAVTLALNEENIGVGIHYRAIHLHSYYRKKYGYKKGDYPNAEYVSDRVFSVPLYPKMTLDDVYDVIHALKRILYFYRKPAEKKPRTSHS